MLRPSWGGLEAALLGEGIYDSWEISINPLSPNCTDIKSPPTCDQSPVWHGSHSSAGFMTSADHIRYGCTDSVHN